MKRLREDIDGADADDLLLARLVASAGPLPPSEVRKRRVLTAVRSRLDEPRRAPRPVLRTALAAGVLLLVGGIAGATVGRSAWERLLGLTGHANVADQGPASGGTVAGPMTAPERTAPVPIGKTVGQPQSQPQPENGSVAPSARQDVPAARPGLVPGEKAPDPRSRGRRAADPMTALYLAGLNAFNSNDPERARVLLEDYLNLAPDGPLGESALAYDIAAAARQSDPEAAALARTYIARFPNGRYLEVAHGALARFPAPPHR